MADACAPKHHTHRSADRMKCFAKGYGATTLNNLGAGNAQMPQFPPQDVEFTNENPTTIQSAIFVTEDGKTQTLPVPPNQTRRSRCAVVSLSAGGGADISAVARWWAVPQHEYDEQRLPSLGAA